MRYAIERRPLFPLGRLVATPDTLAALQKAGQSPAEFLSLHVRGQWGDGEGDSPQPIAVRENNVPSSRRPRHASSRPIEIADSLRLTCRGSAILELQDVQITRAYSANRKNTMATTEREPPGPASRTTVKIK